MITIDDRIGAVELAKYFEIPYIIKRLDFADIVFTGDGPLYPLQIGIERKKIPDLVNSLTDGRLYGHQLVGLLNSYQIVYLLIEGLYRRGETGNLEVYRGRSWRTYMPHGDNRFNYRGFVKALMTLENMFGVKTCCTSGIKDTVQYITYLYSWWSASWESHSSFKQFHKVPLGQKENLLVKPSLTHRILAELDGIGWQRSKDISTQFKSVEDLYNASTKDLREVPGVGKKLAESIYNQLRRKG